MPDTSRPLPNPPCPECGKPAPIDSLARPFCSQRCANIDLGRWLKGQYSISGIDGSAEPGLSSMPDESDSDL